MNSAPRHATHRLPGARWQRPAKYLVAVALPVALLLGVTPSSTADTTPTDTSSGTTTTTTTSTPPPSLPPAPDGFADQMVAVYQAEYDAAGALGQADGLQSVATYQQQVATMTPDDLAAMYYATQQYPQWAQLPELLDTITADATAPAPNAALVRPLTETTPSPDATTVTDKSCPFSDIPTSAIFAAEITLDVANGTHETLDALESAGIEGEAFKPAAVASVVVAIAAEIVHSTLEYLHDTFLECFSENQAERLKNVDETTVETYNLLANLAGTVADIKTDTGTIETNVEQVSTKIDTMEQSLAQEISDELDKVQSTVGSDTQLNSTLLQTLQTAVQQNDTVLQQLMSSNTKTVVSEVDKDTSTVQGSLSQTEAHLIAEVDKQAQSLSSLVTQAQQQLSNSINSGFDTQQQNYLANLKLTIENALANGVNVVEFSLPASKGGYLDAKPVGVQEVVTDDMNAYQQLGISVPTTALNNFNQANSQLGAGQYLAAYGSYIKAYQALKPTGS
ncbi:MAG TPA: hypothetical protein VFT67_15795 [Jatrophihabitantaceae bacterium]|nr:hypothetical protein [Jatrophihabitantaceae bacterium]